ncbi:hypothetical protein C9993_05515 [Marinobacter sp. Z-F4-2]|nr:hypothetical protein C9993_05515 [Marinobacter sp. Z-F4-2]
MICLPFQCLLKGANLFIVQFIGKKRQNFAFFFCRFVTQSNQSRAAKAKNADCVITPKTQASFLPTHSILL